MCWLKVTSFSTLLYNTYLNWESQGPITLSQPMEIIDEEEEGKKNAWLEFGFLINNKLGLLSYVYKLYQNHDMSQSQAADNNKLSQK